MTTLIFDHIKKMKKTNSFILLTIALFLFNIHQSAAQEIKWHAVLGGGLTDMRDFRDGMDGTRYGFADLDGNSGAFRLINKSDYMISGGIGASGLFRKEGILGWDAQFRVRSGGFKIFIDSDVQKKTGESDLDVPETQFGETKAFRYWSLHLPLSLTYMPFEVVGFNIGADLHYQLSSDPSQQKNEKFSDLDLHLGKSPFPSNAVYKHPFNLGAHIGVFVPINDRIRIDAQVFTDLSNRLRFQREQSVNRPDDNQYREMGVSISVAYRLDW